MSQFGLLLVTNEDTIRKACRGWVPALAEKTTKTIINPFTGKPAEVKSQVPNGVDESLDCATLAEIRDELEKAQPVSIDFQLHRQLRKDFLDEADRFLYGYDCRGPVSIDRIPSHLESKVVAHFGDQLGDYAAEANRRQQNLAIYVFVDEF